MDTLLTDAEVDYIETNEALGMNIRPFLEAQERKAKLVIADRLDAYLVGDGSLNHATLWMAGFAQELRRESIAPQKLDCNGIINERG